MVAKGERNSVEVSVDWGSVTSWEAAVSVIGDSNIVPSTVAFGDGSVLLEDKDVLIGAEFMVLDWNYVKNKTTGEDAYVNVLVMNRAGSKVRFNDGGTGVFKQCKEFEAMHGRRGGVYCNKGLRRSDYQVDDGKGGLMEATTYYFA
jgi:hypothetical protein